MLDKFAEKLEDKPDPWFNKPRGWLRKPDFKRDAQKRSTLAAGTGRGLFDSFLPGNTYNRRYFVLDTEKKMLWYYMDDSSSEVKGEVDLKEIVAIDISHVHDAPSHSLDLISADRHYTVTADSQEIMLKWAYAISLLLGKYKLGVGKSATEKAMALATQAPKKLSLKPTADEPSEKWHRYDVVYDAEGPLYLNVMGSANKDHSGKLLNSWIIVTSFELTAEGTPGRSEQSGLISVKDYIVGVNGIDLTTATFNEAMSTIGSASWPKTLHFLRDNESAKNMSRIESWATVYYPALNRRRRRYAEIKQDLIVFHKPAPGGSASADRDSFFQLGNIVSIKPLIDYNVPSDQRYALRLICREGSTVEHVGDDNQSVGGSLVNILELCFPKETHMNAWRSMLVSPSGAGSSASSEIKIHPVEVITVSEAVESISDHLAAKSALTGRFAQRDFTLADGVLRWKRPQLKGSAHNSQNSRSLFLSSSTVCSLVSVRAIELPPTVEDRYRFQLHLNTTDQAVVMGMDEEALLLRWLAKVRELVASCVKEALRPGLVVPDGIERVGAGGTGAGGAGNGGDDGEFFDVIDEHAEEGGNNALTDTLQGYLFKLKEGFLPKGLLSANYCKRWFVLRDGYLSVYRSHIEVPSGIMPLEIIDLRTVYAVREATDSNAPENSIEIVAHGRSYTLAADDDAQMLWLDALGDYLEARDISVRKSVAAPSGHSQAGGGATSTKTEDRIAAIKKAVLFSGGLTMKSINVLTGIVTWRDRYVVITRGAISYYSDASDVYDENKDCIGEVNLAGICSVESSQETRCARGCGLDVTAHVHRGGDSRGLRTFVFEARTPELAKQWMDELCKVSRIFAVGVVGANMYAVHLPILSLSPP